MPEKGHRWPRRSAPVFWIGLGGILLLAAGVRFYRLGEEDYGLDELYSMASSAGRRAEIEAKPYGRIIRPVGRPADLGLHSTAAEVWRTTTRHDTHPPLYFLVLYYWRRLVGDGETAVRSLAVVFSVLSIVPVALMGRKTRSSERQAEARGYRANARNVTYQPRIPIGAEPRAGDSVRAFDPGPFTVTEHLPVAAAPGSDCIRASLLAGLLLALAYSHIWMAQENRQYSLSILLISCGFALLAAGESRWHDPTGRRKVLLALLYAATIFLAMLNHYFAGLAILGQACYALTRFRGPALRWWLISFGGGSAAVAAVWGGAFLGQLAPIRAEHWLLAQAPDHAWQTLLRLADLPLRLLVCVPRFQTSLLHSIAGVILLAGSAGLAFRHRGRWALLFFFWFAVPALGLAVMDWTTHKETLSQLRYAAIAAPGIAGSVALALVKLRAAVRWTLLTALLVTMVIRLELPAPANSLARVAASRLQTLAGPEDLVIYSPGCPGSKWCSDCLRPSTRYWRPVGRSRPKSSVVVRRNRTATSERCPDPVLASPFV